MAVSQYDKENLSSSQQAAIDAVTKAAQSGSMSWADAHSTAESIRSSAGYSGGRYGDEYNPSESSTAVATQKSYNPSSSPSTTDLSGYLNDLYAAQTAAKLSSLQSAYEQNRATLEAQGAKIAPAYQEQKNQTAAQSDLARQQFNEVAATRGLNTGTTGQAALAGNIALQGNLNALSRGQANAESENSLALSNLATEYQNAITEAEASGNSSLASALYDEYVRQAQANTTAAENAQSQSNWEKEYEASLAQNQQSADSETKQYAYKTATAMIESGVMPSTTLLNSAGISYADALSMVNAVKAQETMTASNTQNSSKSSSSSSGSSSKKSSSSGSSSSASSAYNNGNLTTSQVKELQKYYGVTADGAWGSRSSAASGGLSADAAWAKYSTEKVASSYNGLGSYAKSLYNQFGYSYLTAENKVAMVKQAYKDGKITESDANSLLDYLGV